MLALPLWGLQCKISIIFFSGQKFNNIFQKKRGIRAKSRIPPIILLLPKDQKE